MLSEYVRLQFNENSNELLPQIRIFDLKFDAFGGQVGDMNRRLIRVGHLLEYLGERNL